MKLTKIRLTLALSMLLIAPLSALADVYSDTIGNFQKTETARQFFNTAYGYAVFPSIGKGGFIVGGGHGEGKVYRAGNYTGKTSMTQLSVGLQAGGQSYSQIIFFENRAAYDKFTSGNFEFAAGANAIALNASASAQTSTTGNSVNTGANASHNTQGKAIYNNGMVVLTIGKGGLMIDASVAGQKYKFEPA